MSNEREAYLARFGSEDSPTAFAMRAIAADAWDAATKAARQSAGATGQEAVATAESWTNGSYHRNYKLTWHKNVEAGTKLYAAPIGDNGTKAKQQIVDYCTQGENCVCGGDLPQVRAGCYEWVSQPAESKRVELTDAEIAEIAKGVCDAMAFWWADEIVAFARALLARASAKGA
jgi:hypothetical protein